jgi:hypothetical protein
MEEMKLTTQEKSYRLAKLCGWYVVPNDEQPNPQFGKLLMFATGDDEPLLSTSIMVKVDEEEFYRKHLPDLYLPVNMSLAWRVLNWAANHHGIAGDLQDWWFSQRKYLLFGQSAESAQRLWLDKILELNQHDEQDRQ